MTLQPDRKSFTIEEYHRLAEVGIIKETDRVELINGDIITMSPTKSPHAGMVNLLTRLLIGKLKDTVIISCQNPIDVSSYSIYSEPEPDIVIAKNRDDFYSESHPTPEDIYVLIEVSDSTLERDQTIKQKLYASVNIFEYWIINIAEKQIEIYRQPNNNEYHFRQVVSAESSILVGAINLSINYNEIFRGV